MASPGKTAPLLPPPPPATAENEQSQSKKFKRPKVICFDIHGTATKWSFSHKVLIPYLKQYTKFWVETNFENPECQQLIEKLRKGQKETGGPAIPPKTASKEEVCEGVTAYVNHCTDNFLECEGYILFRFAVWFDGFTENRIVTPMYSDVAIQIQKWRCDHRMKLFVVSNGWSVATKKFLEHTSHGDLTLLIEGFYDSQMLGELNKEGTFRNLLSLIGQRGEDVAFLTKNPEAAKAARTTGINGIMVVSHRKNLEQIEGEDLQSLPIIRSFNELEFEQTPTN